MVLSTVNFFSGTKPRESESVGHSASIRRPESPAAPIEQMNVKEEKEANLFGDPYIDPETGDWLLNEFDIECIAIGAGIMGCGGGGSPYLGRLKALELLKAGKEIRVIHPNRWEYRRNHKTVDAFACL